MMKHFAFARGRRARPVTRLALSLFAALSLLSCAGPEIIRGTFHADPHAATSRGAPVFPPAPETARYRYAGELIGEQNFKSAGEETRRGVVEVLKWIAGVFEQSEPVMLQRPQHVATGDDGRIYVVDAGRAAVFVFDPHPPKGKSGDRRGGQLLLWDQIGRGARLVGPVAAIPVWNGEVAVSDSRLGRVFRLNRDGELVGTVGGDEMQRPTGLAFDDARGVLYVADSLTSHVHAYDSSGRLLATLGGPGDETALFNSPTFLSFANDQLYVTDTLNNRVQVFDAAGNWVRAFGQRGLYVGNFTRPKGVAVHDGVVYVVESYYGYLLAYNDRAELLLGINGNGAPGDRFTLPSGVWADKSGKVYVADMLNGRVVIYEYLGSV